MSEDYYKARIGELERELEAAHAELGQYGADIKMLEAREHNLQNIYDREKLWELYRDSRKLFFIQGDGINLQGGSDTNKDALENARAAFKVWKERK